MTVKKPRAGMGAQEFMEQLANDPDYQQRVAKRDAELQQRAAVWTEAEKPIVAALGKVGWTVESVWDLVNTSDPYFDGLPALVEHLKRGGYPDRVMESLGRALAVGPAVAYWDDLRDLYLRATGGGEKTGLAAALSASATPMQLDDLLTLLRGGGNSDTPILFLEAIKRVGGERGYAAIKSLRSDPLFGKEARALLRADTKPR